MIRYALCKWIDLSVLEGMIWYFISRTWNKIIFFPYFKAERLSRSSFSGFRCSIEFLIKFKPYSSSWIFILCYFFSHYTTVTNLLFLNCLSFSSCMSSTLDNQLFIATKYFCTNLGSWNIKFNVLILKILLSFCLLLGLCLAVAFWKKWKWY